MATAKEKEKQLLELLHAAKKAADAAAADAAGGADESRCVDALSRLKDFPVTVQALVSTQVGKQLRPLTKHASKNIQQLASDIFQTWKAMFLEQTNTSNAAAADHKKVTKPSDSDKLHIATPPMKPHTPDRKTPSNNPAASTKPTPSPKPKTTTAAAASTKPNHFPKPKTATPTSSPAIHLPVPKCNDPTRNKIREQLCEALCRVSGEVSPELSSRVNACDPVSVAVSLESVMFASWGGSTGDQRAKYRSLMFNIKDAKNPDFRRKVLLGQWTPEQVVSLSSAEMASDARQKENEKIEAKALFDCELGSAPMATTDQFKCGKCGQRKCKYHQMQTRSADEPMTTYVTCVNCDNRWKFC
ncbi:unnamed protein product [Linum trigynum]|uniref:Transcription elongation factor n=1 Tax=Linum trigynum TaxID=586398 RepID=A0AAV2GBM0_9ROSI